MYWKKTIFSSYSIKFSIIFRQTVSHQGLARLPVRCQVGMVEGEQCLQGPPVTGLKPNTKVSPTCTFTRGSRLDQDCSFPHSSHFVHITQMWIYPGSKYKRAEYMEFTFLSFISRYTALNMLLFEVPRTTNWHLTSPHYFLCFCLFQNYIL